MAQKVSEAVSSTVNGGKTDTIVTPVSSNHLKTSITLFMSMLMSACLSQGWMGGC